MRGVWSQIYTTGILQSQIYTTESIKDQPDPRACATRFQRKPKLLPSVPPRPSEWATERHHPRPQRKHLGGLPEVTPLAASPGVPVRPPNHPNWGEYCTFTHFSYFSFVFIEFCERPKLKTLGSLGSCPKRVFIRVQKNFKNLTNIASLIIVEVDIWRCSWFFICFYCICRTTKIKDFGKPWKLPKTCFYQS